MLTYKEKGKLNRKEQNKYCLQDSMIFCSFSRFGMDDQQRLRFTNAVTGWDYSDEEATLIADRILYFSFAFVGEMREDTLPLRSLYEPMPDGPSKGDVDHLDEMFPEYYARRGWDGKGKPDCRNIRRSAFKRIHRFDM